MNIKEAIEILKNIRRKILEGKRLVEGSYVYYQQETAIETVLAELENKDKAINEVINYIKEFEHVGDVPRNILKILEVEED